MTEWVSKKIISKLVKDGIICQDEDVYLYGCDSIIYTFISTLGLIIISGLSGHFLQGCICILFFYLNQSVGGGFHANAHWKCFAIMAAGLIMGFGIMELTEGHSLLLFTGLPSLAVLFLKPLVLHPYLDHLKASSSVLIRRSRKITCFETGVYILLFLLGSKQTLSVFSVTMLLCAISRIAGWLTYFHTDAV